MAEVPQQLARMINAHVCPKCNAVFGIQIQHDKSWKVKRVDDGDTLGIVASDEQIERLMKKLQREPKEEKPEDDKWKN